MQQTVHAGMQSDKTFPPARDQILSFPLLGAWKTIHISGRNTSPRADSAGIGNDGLAITKRNCQQKGKADKSCKTNADSAGIGSDGSAVTKRNCQQKTLTIAKQHWHISNTAVTNATNSSCGNAV